MYGRLKPEDESGSDTSSVGCYVTHANRPIEVLGSASLTWVLDRTIYIISPFDACHLDIPVARAQISVHVRQMALHAGGPSAPCMAAVGGRDVAPHPPCHGAASSFDG